MSDEESVNWDLKEIKSKDPEVKWTALNNLSKYLQSNPKSFRARMIVKSFLSMINDPDNKIRETVYTTLISSLTDSKGLESLIMKGLADTSPSIRSISLEWLHNSNHPSVVSETVKFLQDPSDAVKKTAIDIVLSRDVKNIENQLLELLKNEKGVLRRSVIFALGKMKTDAAIDALTKIMKDPEFDDWTRNQASSALEHMGSTNLMVPHIENLIDPNEYVKQTAAAFLKKNEKDLETYIASNQRIDYLAFIQHATDTTKQDFSQTINNLKNQLAVILQTMMGKFQEKDILVLNELSKELNVNQIALDIIINRFLSIELYPQQEGRYYTNKGLKRILHEEFEKKHSLLLHDIQKVKPFNEIELPKVIKLLEELDYLELISQELYILKEDFSKIKKNFELNGKIEFGKIASDIHQSPEIVQKELIRVLVPNETGWINNKKEFLTLKYITDYTKETIAKQKIIDLEQFIKTIGNPKITISQLKEIISNHTEGKWLDDINVFIIHEEFKELEENSIRIDEERVKHLLEAINIKFPIFLTSLQKILEIKTFKTKGGQLISLENLFPRIQQIMTENSFFPLSEFLRENNLDPNLKSTIVEHLNEKFSGKTDEKAEYYLSDDLLAKIQQECEKNSRINFNVLAFKLNITSELLEMIILKVLGITGIHNNLGEFITFKGVENEYEEILKRSESLAIQTLVEILEIENNKSEIEKLVKKIREKTDIHFSADGKMMSFRKT